MTSGGIKRGGGGRREGVEIKPRNGPDSPKREQTGKAQKKRQKGILRCRDVPTRINANWEIGEAIAQPVWSGEAGLKNCSWNRAARVCLLLRFGFEI